MALSLVSSGSRSNPYRRRLIGTDARAYVGDSARVNGLVHRKCRKANVVALVRVGTGCANHARDFRFVNIGERANVTPASANFANFFDQGRRLTAALDIAARSSGDGREDHSTSTWTRAVARLEKESGRGDPD